MPPRTLSASLADTARTVDAVAAGYAHASEVIAPALRHVPDGCVLVGAMDGWTVEVPIETSSANGDLTLDINGGRIVAPVCQVDGTKAEG